MVSRGCEHRGTISSLCGLPSGIATCNEQKNHTMPCGHIFPGICGEKIPKSCVECEIGATPICTMISLSCGHSFDVDHLDSHVKFPSNKNGYGYITKPLLVGNVAEFNLTCPVCEKTIEDVERYSVLREMQNFSGNVDRLISEIGRKLAEFGKSISYNESQLQNTFPAFRNEISPTPLAASGNRRKVQERARDLIEVQEQIAVAKGKSSEWWCVEME